MRKSNNDSALTTKWSHRRFIIGLTALAVSLALQAQDYARLGERTIMGTARYVGMGGAMTAIGADPSAVHDNPAGLGLYQRMEVLVGFDEMLDYTHQVNGVETSHKRLFTLPHASWVLSIPNYHISGGKGIEYNNIMFSYHRLQSFTREMYAVAPNGDVSLGALLADAGLDLGIGYCKDPYSMENALRLNESGYVGEYAFDWSMNISHQWYVGAGIHIQSYAMSADATYAEDHARVNKSKQFYYIDNATSVIYNGVGCNLSAGVLYRPLWWLRIGFGLQTPTLGSLTTSTSGTLTAMTDSLAESYAPDLSGADRDFHMPLHTSTSVAFHLGHLGLLALQHDYLYSYKDAAVHSLRAGLEIVPVEGLYINLGYAYESPFRKAELVVPMDPTFDRQDTYFQCLRSSQYASAGIGYRGTHIMVQAAYQYRWQQINWWAHEAAKPYDMRTDTHRIVLTLGWHRN